VFRCLAFCLCFAAMCAGHSAGAADIPLTYAPALKAKIAKPVVRKTPIVQKTPVVRKAKIEEAVVDNGIINLSLDLKAFEANADGPKQEDSASLQRKLVISRTADVPLPQLSVTVIGHIVKTRDSTARIDVKVGPAKHSFVWEADEVKSGGFEFRFDGMLPNGEIPSALHVTAIAFVTKLKKSSVVLVSVDKINVTISSARVAAKQ
jgi:hypothetical protein